MAVTIKDVAKASGFSITTVSLVLNNKPNRISEKTKKIIFETAERLQYRPNQVAVSMVTKKSKTIGVILPDISNIYFSELAKSIEIACSKEGYIVLYSNTSDKSELDYEYVSTFLSRGVDGLIIVPANNSTKNDHEKLMKLIEKFDIPLLAVDRELIKNKMPLVTVDHFMGGYLGTKYLIERGHKVIGCISGPKNSNISNMRLEGYKKALQESNIAFDDRLVYYGNFKSYDGVSGLKNLLEQKITGIFAFNDMMALGVYSEARNLGITIPNDLSLVGYDDVFFAEFTNPPLTTISQPVNEIGIEASKLIINLINKNKGENVVILKPTIIERESTKYI